MATADWNPLGNSYYSVLLIGMPKIAPLVGNCWHRKYEMHSMQWTESVDISKSRVAAAPYGGPIALLMDVCSPLRAGLAVNPVVRVFNAAGQLIAKMTWNSGPIMKMGWSVSEDLLFVRDDGVVLVYDLFLNFERTFGMGQEAKEVNILDAKIFSSNQGTGIAVMTTSFRVFLITDYHFQRIFRLADIPELNSAPGCWDVVVADRQAHVMVGHGGDVYVAEQGHQYRKHDLPSEIADRGEYVDMAVAFDHKSVALLTSKGYLWMGSADLTRTFGEFETKLGGRPCQMAWCENSAVVILWQHLMLVVGPQKYWIEFVVDCPTHLSPELDGLRIIGSHQHEFLERVPEVTEQIFKIGSMDPGAMLFEANREYQKRSQKADEYLRMIRDTLDVGVDQCTLAAGFEYQPGRQKELLQAASFGKCFLADYRPDEFVDMNRTLRVLHQMRHHLVGMPLTIVQLRKLTMPVLIDRLVLRRLFGLAVLVCRYLKVPDCDGQDRITAHWACHKVRQKHISDDDVVKVITKKVVERPGISFFDIANQALELGRKQLAIKLLEYETRASDQVPLLLKMGQASVALLKAIDSGDTDLVYLVLLHLRDNLEPSQFYMMLHTMPVAFSLFLHYCRQENLSLVDKLLEQEDRHAEIGFVKIIRSYSEDSFTARCRLLQDSGQCFHRAGNLFIEKHIEEQIKLLQQQRRLEDEVGRSFVDMSLHQTMHTLTTLGHHSHVDRLHKDFKVPDKRFCWMRAMALAEVGDWSELERFSKSKKLPVGMQVFVEVCMRHNNRQEALKYLSCVAPDRKVRSLVQVGQHTEAANQAFENKNEDDLLYVLGKVKVTDKVTTDHIKLLIGRLSSRR